MLLPLWLALLIVLPILVAIVVCASAIAGLFVRGVRATESESGDVLKLTRAHEDSTYKPRFWRR